MFEGQKSKTDREGSLYPVTQVNGGSLPQRVTPFCIGGAVFGAFLPLFAALLDWEVDRLNKLPASSGFRLKAVSRQPWHDPESIAQIDS